MSVLVIYAIIGLSKAMAEELDVPTPETEKDVELNLDFTHHVLSSDLYFNESNYQEVSNHYYNADDNKKIGQDLVDTFEMFIANHDTGKRFRFKAKFDHRLNFKKVMFVWRIKF